MRTETKKRPKIVVLLGPTACGKTAWGLKLAKKFNGAIISADSRQIYKKMSIGTAKVPGEWVKGVSDNADKVYCAEGIPHYLVDFLDPGKMFTVADFRDRAIKYVKFARKSNKLPLVVGGTGLYISALADNLYIPRVPPNKKLRRSLEQKHSEDLRNILRLLDPESADTIDRNNKRRIIRALEVSILSGKPFSKQRIRGEPLFDVLKIGIKVPKDLLYRRIEERVDKMMEAGLLDEIDNLLKQRYGWNLPSMSGIGYRQFREYFEGSLKLDKAVEILKRDTRRYARRQLTWFRRDAEIQWCEEYQEAENFVSQFLKF